MVRCSRPIPALLLVALCLAGCSRPPATTSTAAPTGPGAIGLYARVVHLPDSQGFPLQGRRFVQVSRVLPGSAAERAGLRPGDELRAIDGDTVASAGFAMDRIAAAPPGSTLTLRVLRAGEDLTLPVTVGAQSEVFAAEGAHP